MFGTGSPPGGNPYSRKTRDEPGRDGVGIEIGGDIGVRLRRLDLRDNRGAKCTIGRRADFVEGRPGCPKFGNRIDAETRLTRFPNHAVDHGANAVDCPLARPENGSVGLCLSQRVSTHRGAVESRLVAETVIQALSPDPHGIDQHLRRRAFIAMLAEYADRCVKRHIIVKGFWSRHAAYINIMERLFNNNLRVREFRYSRRALGR